jgi:hypothetical protein
VSVSERDRKRGSDGEEDVNQIEADNSDQLEQHQCLSLLHVQLVRYRRYPSIGPHDPSRQLQRAMYLVRYLTRQRDYKLTISGEIVKGVSANKNLEVTDQCLFLFGNGDGGGGPTPLMMEKVGLFLSHAFFPSSSAAFSKHSLSLRVNAGDGD